MSSRKSEKQQLKEKRIEAEQALAVRKRNRLIVGVSGLLLTVAVVTVALVVTPRTKDSTGEGHETYAHVHGLGVNPADQALFIATHDGLFRSGSGDLDSRPVGDSRQDLMGFGVTGPNSFVASGHPAPGQDSPPDLGLIRSTDAGKTWKNVSLLGEADFHVLRAVGSNVYGLNGATGELLLSEDAGASWDTRELPEGTVDIAVNPKQPDQAVAATSDGVMRTSDAAKSWIKAGDAPIGLIGWSEDGHLYLVDSDGAVSLSKDEGVHWTEMGKTDGQPTAVLATPDALYVALDNNSVEQSTDDGATWSIRAQP